MTQVDLKGFVPDFVTEMGMKRTCKGLRDLYKAMSARRLLSQGTELILHGARTCALCATLFAYGADKIHCRFCPKPRRLQAMQHSLDPSWSPRQRMQTLRAGENVGSSKFSTHHGPQCPSFVAVVDSRGRLPSL
ncbi:hypothetical protein Ae201684P_009474 [Aphanomyces euteiches]|nr:hypothetical protein Ae201684P_009474 [Aphanomyces euteiches]